MKRLVALLVIVAIALTGAAFWAYDNASADYDFTNTLCRISGDCTASMEWTSTLVFAGLAAVAVVGALLISKRTKDLVD